jgi:hypothetical protein
MGPEEAFEIAMKLARVAYEGYCAATGWKSAKTGEPLPQWDAQSMPIRMAWLASSNAVVGELRRIHANQGAQA